MYAELSLSQEVYKIRILKNTQPEFSWESLATHIHEFRQNAITEIKWIEYIMVPETNNLISGFSFAAAWYYIFKKCSPFFIVWLMYVQEVVPHFM